MDTTLQAGAVEEGLKGRIENRVRRRLRAMVQAEVVTLSLEEVSRAYIR